jgi:hypothetical protein
MTRAGSGRTAIGPHDGPRRVLGAGAYYSMLGAVFGLAGARHRGLGAVLDAAWHIGLGGAAVLGVLGAVVGAFVSPGKWGRKVGAGAAGAGCLALGGFLFGTLAGALFGGLEALLVLATGGWEGGLQSALTGAGIGALLGMATAVPEALRTRRANRMTEDDWRACCDPQRMLGLLGTRANGRKLRLFGCGCVRRAWALLDERGRWAVEAAEEVANGRVAPGAMRSAWSVSFGGGEADVAAEVARAAEAVCYLEADLAAQEAALACARAADQADMERSAQAALLRDVFNPFRPARLVQPAWRAWGGGTVARLAQAAYEEWALPAGILDITRLCILADALEDAGCTDAELLGHLRGPGPHLRGCWAIDAVLGKS